MTSATAETRTDSNRSSPLRALLWKEWRQQRWVYLTLLALAYGLAVAGHLATTELAWVVLLGLARFFGPCGVLILSANAFCGEQEDSSNQFLDAIPCGRGRIFRVKLGFILALGLLELAPLIAWLLLFRNRTGFAVIPGLWPNAPDLAVLLVILAAMPALIASFRISTMATFLISIPAVVGYVYLIFFASAALRAATHGLWCPWIFIFLTTAALFLAAQLFWTRRTGTLWRSLRAATTVQRALLWKEWRQQRWVYLILLGLAYGLVLLGYCMTAESGFRQDLIGISALSGVVGVLILSANAFCGEQEDSSNQFLDAIPCGRGSIFRVKLGFVLLLSFLGLTPLTPWLPMNPAGWSFAIILAVLLVTIATIPALVASFGVSAIAAILVSVPVVAGFVAFMYYSMFRLATCVLITVTQVSWSAWTYLSLYVLLTVATLFLAAQRLWTMRERTRRRCVWTLAVSAALVVAYVAVPTAAAWYYVTCRAPLTFFMKDRPGLVSGDIAGVSPNGRYAIFNASYAGWGNYGGRAALANIESGQYQWLTRFRYSYFWPREILWLPSGDKFVLDEADRWLFPTELWNKNALQGHGDERHKYFIVDARTGTQLSLDETCPGLPQITTASAVSLAGWYNEHVFAIGTERDMFFADIETHKTHRCHGTPGSNIYIHAQAVCARGYFAVPWAAVNGELRVLRYAPELPEAETLVLHGITGTPVSMDVSSDGQWLLLDTGPGDFGLDRWYTARLQNGAEAVLRAPQQAGLDRYLEDWGCANRFVPGSHEVFVIIGGDAPVVDLFNAETHRVRRIPFQVEGKNVSYRVINPNVNGSGYTVKFSPRGGFALLQLASQGYIAVDLNRCALSSLTIGPCGWDSIWWLGEDRLLFETQDRSDGPRELWVINRDGSWKRQLKTQK